MNLWHRPPDRPTLDERIKEEEDEARRAAMEALGTADLQLDETATGLFVASEKPELSTGQYL